MELADRAINLRLKLHVFGHIHESYGQIYDYYSSETTWDSPTIPRGCLNVNASIMDGNYRPVNKPIRVIL